MTKQQVEIILAYAESDMNAVAAGKKIYMSAANVSHHLNRIREQMGWNPKRFYDLCYW